MSPKYNNGKPRRKRSVDPLSDLPGLFDHLDIDLSSNDAFSAAEIAAEQPRQHVSQTADLQSLNIDTTKLVRPSSLRFISFGSGSSGNCSYLGFDAGEGRSTGVLIDAGVEPDRVYEALSDNRIDLRSITGILLTHDHGDHVKYAYNIVRANKHMVIYTTMRTMTGILRRHSISSRIKDYQKIIYIEHPFDAGKFTVTAFKTSHDGTENVGFAIDSHDGQHKFVITTDTGFITPEADRYLRMANYIIIESNYDKDMLVRGPYPEYLKARIVGERGHMDNIDTARYLAEIVSPAVSHVFLCHLSEENNTPEIALRTTRDALVAKGLRIGDPANPLSFETTDLSLAVLPRNSVTPQYILRHKKK